MAARRDESAAVADSLTADAAVDVAPGRRAERPVEECDTRRIRRHQLASELRDGRHYIPVVELLRRDLLISGARYTSLRERADSLDAQLHDALETREHLQEELDEAQAKVRMVWGMARQSDQKLERARKRRWGIRWPFRRSAAGH